MIKNWIFGLIIGAGLTACSSVSVIQVDADSIPIDELASNSYIDSIIGPYRDSLEDEMNVVIGYAPESFEKGRPNGSLNNWASDVVGESMAGLLNGKPFFCLLNVGGLRNTINKGPVTIGDIFKVMPFDNEVVAVQLPAEVKSEIEEYLVQREGEPISNAVLENAKLTIPMLNAESEYFWVITSDYLMNGGDNMSFFSKRTQEVYLGKLMRDVMIEAVKAQDTLKWNTEERILIK